MKERKFLVRNPNSPVIPRKIEFKEIVLDKNCKIFLANNKGRPWIADKNGYLLIRPKKETGEIEVGICDYDEINKVKVLVVGKNPEEIYHTIIDNNLISRLDHAAYLGKELQKAFFSLTHSEEYKQD